MSIKQINKEEFQKIVVEGTEPVLVGYTAPWCVYCKRMAPAMEKLAEQYAGKFNFYKVDIDEEPGLAEDEKIEVIPTMVIYKDGKALSSIVAPESKAQVETFIAEKLGL
ncbi:MAG: thioredoxin family protein [Acidaminococcaceae bacterium]|nr:thioredoxin family protein [Acidaminococcaceae bacterium]